MGAYKYNRQLNTSALAGYSSSGLPYLVGIYRKKPLELKLHEIASNQPRNDTGHKRNYKRVQLHDKFLVKNHFLILPLNSIFFPRTNPYNFAILILEISDADVYVTKVNTNYIAWATCAITRYNHPYTNRNRNKTNLV